MRKSIVPVMEHQEKVDDYFQSQSVYWNDVYKRDGAFAEFIRDRHTVVLEWIDSLRLAPGSQVLEIGCGAGFMSIALAQRGFRVHAIDSAEAMVELARQHAIEAGAADLLFVESGNVYSLAFEDEFFDLVIAVGVMSWLDQPERAIQEMARVTRAGGYVIFTAANCIGLSHLLDPWLNPLFTPLKLRLKAALERFALRPRLPSMILLTRHFIDEALVHAHLSKIRGKTLGFGPFSFFRRTILKERWGIALHRKLQYLADRNVPGIRSTGRTHVVLARKPMSDYSSNQ